ncbi:Gamma adaptin [Giardia muris]|uniref:Gamma adaptin n=1 Tax=Giardia muris TaxID=5742 RepID=A0A4Z1T638_GIAMU|nr:Gamma adaptin [Giardia muris]|eukprot:TNJ27921.1 Gamma adaptin [Giardia muris]
MAEDFVRRVRTAKTPSQEREVVELELARIRAGLKMKCPDLLSDYLARLLFAYLWRYDVSWAEHGVVELCGVAKLHADRRLAMLALTLLVHTPERLVMTTNSLLNSLTNPSQYKVAVVLHAAASVTAPSMCETLFDPVISIVTSNASIYVRKKAMMALCSIVREVPKLAPKAQEVCLDSLRNRVHSLVLTGCILGKYILDSYPAFACALSDVIYHLFRVLTRLNASSSSSEKTYEISGCNDPALQVGLLSFIRAAFIAGSILSNEKGGDHESSSTLTSRTRLRRDLLMRFANVTVVQEQGTDILEGIIGPTGLPLPNYSEAYVSLFTEEARGYVRRTLRHLIAELSISKASSAIITGLRIELLQLLVYIPPDFIRREDYIYIMQTLLDQLSETLRSATGFILSSVIGAFIWFIRVTRTTANLQALQPSLLDILRAEGSRTLHRRILTLLILLVDKETSYGLIDELLELMDQSTSTAFRGDVGEAIRTLIVFLRPEVRKAFDIALSVLLKMGRCSKDAANPIIYALTLALTHPDASQKENKEYFATTIQRPEFRERLETCIDGPRQHLLLVALYVAQVAPEYIDAIWFNDLACHIITRGSDDCARVLAVTTLTRVSIATRTMGGGVTIPGLDDPMLNSVTSPIVLQRLAECRRILANPKLHSLLKLRAPLCIIPPSIRVTKSITESIPEPMIQRPSTVADGTDEGVEAYADSSTQQDTTEYLFKNEVIAIAYSRVLGSSEATREYVFRITALYCSVKARLQCAILDHKEVITVTVGDVTSKITRPGNQPITQTVAVHSNDKVESIPTPLNLLLRVTYVTSDGLRDFADFSLTDKEDE